MQVLIADDDVVSRRMLANMLARWNYEVVVACDGDQAWQLLQQDGAPRLAILDWMMPGMTGPAVCHEVRRKGSEPYTYILLLTARTQKQDLIEGMEAGADDYITKPFDSQELHVRLRAGHRILELQAELLSAREAMRELATRDQLTHLWNRYSILDILNREVRRAEREATTVGVIMADLDHFKNINDTHGHLAGDAVLREVAARLENSLRTYDAVGRYGGEEFLMVLPGTSLAAATQLAERLRLALECEPITFGDRGATVTVSLGVTASTEATSAQGLIRSADLALYRAKALGRNRVESTAEPVPA